MRRMIYFLKNYYYYYYLLYNIVLVLPHINMNPPRVYTCSQSRTPLPPVPPLTHTIPPSHPSAPAPSILHPASNLDLRFVSYMILYVFQFILKYVFKSLERATIWGAISPIYTIQLGKLDLVI